MTDSPTPPAETGPFLTVTEAAALLGRSDKSIRRMIERGDLHAVKVRTATGQAWRIERASVEQQQQGVTDPDGRVTDSNSRRRTGDGQAMPPYPPRVTEPDGQETDTEMDTERLHIQRVTDSDGQGRGDVGTVTDSGGQLPSLSVSPSTGSVSPPGVSVSPPGVSVTPRAEAELHHVSELVTAQGRDIEQIKAYIAGDLGALLRERLAGVPTRDEIAESTSAAITQALAPLFDRLQEQVTRDDLASLHARIDALQSAPDASIQLQKREARIAELEAELQAARQTQFGSETRNAQGEQGSGDGRGTVPPPIKRPWWMFWAD